MFKLTNVVKKYENGNVAIRGLSLEIADRGMVAFTGPSGSGKTTLLNLLSMNDTTSEGKIEWSGTVYNDESRKSLTANFAYIYQDYKLIENISVRDNLRIATELSERVIDENRIDSVLEEIGLKDFAEEKVLNLSAGQKQRVAIARAIVREPQVLFADEPTGNLDSENTDNILSILKNLSREILVLIVTHDTESIIKYADRIVRIKDGKVDTDTSLENNEIKSNDKEEKREYCVKKSALSKKSVFTLLKSLNGGKKGRKIAFSIVAMLLICFLIPLASWAFLTYEKSAIGTYKAKANTDGMILSAVVNKKFEGKYSNGDGAILGTYEAQADLTSLKEFIGDKIKGNAADIVDISNMRRISKLYTYTRTVDKNDKPISIAHACSFYNTQYVILSDDPSSIGIKIIKGVAPKSKFEFLISSGMYEYLNAVGCIKNPDESSSRSYIDMTGDEIIGKEVYGAKIVGVFEDNFDIPKKYYEYCYSSKEVDGFKTFGDRLMDEVDVLRKKLFENILCRSVIASLAMAEYYNDISLLNTTTGGEYFNVQLSANDIVYAPSVGMAPANENTKIFTKEITVQKGEILIPKSIAEQLEISQGDNVELTTSKRTQVRHNPNETLKEVTIDEIGEKTFKAVISDNDIRAVFLSASDFKTVTDNYKMNKSLLYFHKKGIEASDLVKMKNFVIDEYNLTNQDVDKGLQYQFDYSGGVIYQYSSMSDMIIIAYVALALVSIIYLLMIYNIVGINITGKSNELLILKSLGASRAEIAKVYGLSMCIRIVIEFIVGLLLGSLILLGLNGLISVINETEAVAIPLDGVSVAIVLVVVVLVNVISLAVNLLKISDKNLRRAFQKTKE